MEIRNVLWFIAAAALLSGCGGAVSVGGKTGAPSGAVYTFPSGKGGMLISPGFDAVEGNLFQIAGGADLVVTALGFEYERPSQQAAPTAIFDSDGNILASAMISGTDTLSDGYYWKAINPITLVSGNQYYIGSLHGTGPGWQYIWNTHVASTPSSVADLGTYFKVSSTIFGSSWQFGGGTSQYGSGEIRHYVGNFKAHPAP